VAVSCAEGGADPPAARDRTSDGDRLDLGLACFATPRDGTLLHTPRDGTLLHTPRDGTLLHTPRDGTLLHTPRC
jgi:hypothetical protein